METIQDLYIGHAIATLTASHANDSIRQIAVSQALRFSMGWSAYFNIFTPEIQGKRCC